MSPQKSKTAKNKKRSGSRGKATATAATVATATATATATAATVAVASDSTPSTTTASSSSASSSASAGPKDTSGNLIDAVRKGGLDGVAAKKLANAASDSKTSSAACVPDDTTSADHDDADEVEGNKKEEEEGPKHDTSKAELARVNDAGVDRELSSESASQAAATRLERSKQHTEAERLRQQVLNAVKVRQEDIDLIAEQMEISKVRAERFLREHEGNVKDTLRTLMSR
eukprot:gene901-4164_t